MTIFKYCSSVRWEHFQQLANINQQCCQNEIGIIAVLNPTFICDNKNVQVNFYDSFVQNNSSIPLSLLPPTDLHFVLTKCHTIVVDAVNIV